MRTSRKTNSRKCGSGWAPLSKKTPRLTTIQFRGFPMNSETNAPATTPAPEQTQTIGSGPLPVDYRSPTLAALPVKERPKNTPACETCPISLWFMSSEALKCFCPRMHSVSWQKSAPPIVRCDGRELAVMDLMVKRASRKNRRPEQGSRSARATAQPWSCE